MPLAQHDAGDAAVDPFPEAVAVRIKAGGPLPWSLEAIERASVGVAAAQAFAGGAVRAFAKAS